ncbi:hypothetical protein [Pinibacter soli]|uniref:Uncharacterized protein n=1 Tax=Pinibacter soli TaxID=3044211 RepID=A0ABT6RF76_9BACT|nr:hypothetical protein [Pinibacter soli]MDI3321190.1 hypothetical protein [Pinibacter soli]
MRHLVILIKFTILSAICFGQQNNTYIESLLSGKYYPENRLIKNNHIKYVIDSCELTLPGEMNIKIYDILGRLIGDINYPIDSFRNPFIYRISGDTTYRLKYNDEKTALLGFERFIQNNKGQVQSYLDCYNYYGRKDSYYVGYEEFFYDEKNLLKTKLTYFKEDYPGNVSDQIEIKPTSLELNDVVYYSYQNLKGQTKLVIGRHGLGKAEWRKTDSAIYDKYNRIIRLNSFSKSGTIGELVHNNLNRITEYIYTDTSLETINYEVYCDAPPPNIDCFPYTQTSKDMELIIYNKDKLKRAVYGFYANGKKYLIDKFEYHCY